MMTSKLQNARQVFVWIWLPNRNQPIVAGRIDKHNDFYQFTYGKSYLQNVDAIPISPFELPLNQGTFSPEGMNIIHSCLRDGAPDAWGRRLIHYLYPQLTPNEIDYMLLSDSNRIGALDFQFSATEYISRDESSVSLSDLIVATEHVEKNKLLPEKLRNVLLHGTSVGGARPKALIKDNDTKIEYIAKVSSTTDTYNIIKAEYIAMRLAEIVGITVPKVQLKVVLHKDVLLVERFDRKKVDNINLRKLMLSGLSLLGLNELEARYASYCDMAEVIRKHFSFPKQNLEELYKRLIFNILIGNNDDHARNHSAFWSGKELTLTPAYDLCPQARTGFEATQAMAIEGIEGNFSTLVNVLSVCQFFQIEKNDAREIMEKMIETIKTNWSVICEEAELSSLEQERLWEKSIFNPFCFRGF